MSITFTAVDLAGPAGPVRIRMPVEVLVSFSADTAYRLFSLLGLDAHQFYGEVSLPELQRALMRARARLPRDAATLARPERRLYGRPRECRGVTELRPEIGFVGGIDEERLCDRLGDVAAFAEAAASAGATHIGWE